MIILESTIEKEENKTLFVKQIGIIVLCFFISILPIFILTELNAPPAMCYDGGTPYPMFPPPHWYVWAIPIGMLVILCTIIGLKIRKMWILHKASKNQIKTTIVIVDSQLR
jgi:hypothetical protein